MSRKFLALILLCLATPHASAQDDSLLLNMRRAVDTAKQKNPLLRAALAELKSARWNVTSNSAANAPVLQLDGNVSQVSTPNVFGNAVRVNRMRRAELGLQLSKRLWVGTELSLRLSTAAFKSEFSSGTTVLSPGSPPGGMGQPVLPGFGYGSFGPVYAAVAKLSLKQPLWRGRGRAVGQAELRAARLQRDESELERDRVASEVLRDVLIAYWELWYADATVAIYAQSRAVSARQREDAQARIHSGSLAGTELLSFETQLATREEDVVRARMERQRSAHQLARKLGIDAEGSADIVLDDPLPETNSRSFTRRDVEARAEAECAELRRLSTALELARLRAKTADDPKKPRLDLDGYVQAQGIGNESYSDATRQFVGGDALSGYVGLTYEAPLTGRVRRAEAARAHLATTVAEEELREARQRILSEVRIALDREQAGRETVALAERTVETAENQLAAEHARYMSGSSTALVLLESEDKVRSAKLRLARARADLEEAILEIDHLSGDLLRRHASL